MDDITKDLEEKDVNKEDAMPSEDIQPETEIERLTRERNDYLDGWQRAKADFINFKREESERLEGAMRYAASHVIEDMLPVLDSFDLGLRSLEAQGTTVDKGILLIRSQMEDVLRRRGLEKIEVKPGDAFDPTIHEGMAEVESKEKTGSVADIIEPGYRLAGRIIRPARVRVSKGLRESNSS